MTRADFVQWFIGELTRVLDTLVEKPAAMDAARAAEGGGYVLTMAPSDGGPGQLHVHFAKRGATGLVRALDGGGSEVSDSRILETLRHICERTLAGFDAQQHGVSLVVVSASPAAGAPEGITQDIVVKELRDAVQVTVTGDLQIGDASEPAAAPAQTLDVIMDLDLPLVVRFGRTELPLKVLTGLGPGSVIDLGRAPDEPVDVLISNRVVARGEVVIVAGNYGVRVHDVVSAAERARSLEAELS